MSTIFKGKVSFVNHEKQYVTIEYKPDEGGKAKTLNGNISVITQQKLKKEGIIKKMHTYQVGDIVNFVSKLSDKGDKMIAANVQYLFNEGLDTILNKAKTGQTFNGYMKLVDGKFYIKEIETYLFFPLEISAWQTPFTDKQLNEAIAFTLENIDKKEKATAKLLKVSYIPEYQKALKYYNDKTIIDAKVCLVNAFGIYVNVVGEKIQAKIPIEKANSNTNIVKVDDIIKIKIIYLTPLKIVVEAV